MALMESKLMEKGTKLIPFALPDIDNQIVSSDDYREVPLLLVVFSCNHCPYAIASWPPLNELNRRYKEEGLRIVAINPNNNPGYPDDSHPKMKEAAQKYGIEFPYLFDGDQQIARAYGAVCTPDPFLFKDGKLFYHGRINDNWQHPEKIKERSLELFIRNGLGHEVSEPQKIFPSMGCSIKWVD